MDSKQLATYAVSRLNETLAETTTLMRAIEDNGGELTPLLENHLNLVENRTAERVDSVYMLLERLEHEAAFFEAREKELRSRRMALENSARRLKEQIKTALATAPGLEITGHTTKFKLSPTAERLVIDDEDALPQQYVIIETVRTPDRERIKADLLAMKNVPGARLEGGFSLRKSVFASQLK